MRPPLSKHQAAWVTSQEHDAGHQDATDDFEEAVHQMDLEAIDAPIERAAASQKLQAVTEENTKGADTVKVRVNGSMPRAAPCTSSSQMMVRKVTHVDDKRDYVRGGSGKVGGYFIVWLIENLHVGFLVVVE